MRKSNKFHLIKATGILLCAILPGAMLLGACSIIDMGTTADSAEVTTSATDSAVSDLSVTAIEILTIDGESIYKGKSLNFDSSVVNSTDRYIVRVAVGEGADCSEYVFANVVFGEAYELSVYRAYEAVYLSLGKDTIYGGRPSDQPIQIDISETVAPDV